MEPQTTVGRRRPLGLGRVERNFNAALEAHAASRATAAVRLAPVQHTRQEAPPAPAAVPDASQSRGWDWIFGALFEAARVADQSGGAPHGLSNLGTMALRLPDTVTVSP